MRQGRVLQGVYPVFSLWLCLHKILTFLLDRFWKASGTISRSDKSAREVVGARPVAEC